ncbi:hypothetical protein D6851_15730 [Altericroceibacterium spongiae]|uniref:Uncharacterized protein n=1 Tax=Altericroceibacterium spongiae TaxID=2320269 RepID=A0A420EAJ7_9SPHN|nr:hypothetical protein [Altericroceibacterium spongiae]RKF17708.1 hypothetical protein D6851_15730 [Altericroceibacterium spongiae]
MIDRLKEWLPAPMAARESNVLKAARYRVILSLAVIALLVLFWGPVTALVGRVALYVLIGLVVFCAAQVPIWLALKRAADDAWLYRDQSDE